MDYETQCAAKKVNCSMGKNYCISPQTDGNSSHSEVPLKIINTMHEPFGRKRKTPNDFEMDSGTLCVSKKGNLGVRKNSCIFSQPNGNSRHSEASLNRNTMHETSVPIYTDAMGNVDPSALNEPQQLSRLMSQMGSSNDASTVTAAYSHCTDKSTHTSFIIESNVDCPTKNLMSVNIQRTMSVCNQEKLLSKVNVRCRRKLLLELIAA